MPFVQLSPEIAASAATCHFSSPQLISGEAGAKAGLRNARVHALTRFLIAHKIYQKSLESLYVLPLKLSNYSRSFPC